MPGGCERSLKRLSVPQRQPNVRRETERKAAAEARRAAQEAAERYRKEQERKVAAAKAKRDARERTRRARERTAIKRSEEVARRAQEEQEMIARMRIAKAYIGCKHDECLYKVPARGSRPKPDEMDKCIGWIKKKYVTTINLCEEEIKHCSFQRSEVGVVA
jgi:membrane protein involved in colicin uptake